MDRYQEMLPQPLVDLEEEAMLISLTERYERMIQPGVFKRAAGKVKDALPEGVKAMAKDLTEGMTEAEIYAKAMEIAGKGFKEIESQAAKFSVSEQAILASVSSKCDVDGIANLNEICFARAYDVTRAVEGFKRKQVALAAAEGALTGAPGVPGIPFNLVLSTFIYFRAVQSIAMYYGYDVKSNPEELIIAGEVFSSAMSPGSSNGEAAGLITKLMVVCEAEGVKQAAKKKWADMVARRGAALIIAQLRALANKAAENALKSAGVRGLENSVFKAIFEQLGRRLTLKTVQNAVPVVSAAFCALFDTAYMKQVIDFAEIFYSKRFLIEKEERIARLVFPGISEGSSREADLIEIEVVGSESEGIDE